MKKGATHADWAVSLGIFLVYILSLFLLIQPGVEPIFRNENLIKIVDNSFFTDTRLNLEKTPIIFTPVEIEQDGNYIAEIRDSIPIAKASMVIEDFSIRDGNNNPLPFALEFGVDDAGNAIITRLRVNAYFSAAAPTKLYLYYSPGLYDAVPLQPGITISDGEVIGGEQRSNFTRIFGSLEVVSGINKNIISINPQAINFPCTTQQEYADLKEEWNYPPNKDFQIFMVNVPLPRYALENIIDVCNQAQPFEQASVFVQERVDVTLDRDGNQEPLRINMRVW